MTNAGDLEARLAAVEEAVAELREASRPTGHPAVPAGGDFWVLEGLESRHPEGSVAFAGSLEVPGKGPVRWQYGLLAEALLERDWSGVAGELAALAHPVRLQLLQLVFNGVTATADLVAHEGFGTSGQVHHHLRILVAAGWLATVGRGHYQIPATRVIPLLVIGVAAQRP